MRNYGIRMKSLRNDIITNPEPSLHHFVCFEFFFFCCVSLGKSGLFLA